MKTIRSTPLAALGMFICVIIVTATVSAQLAGSGPEINWYTVDGGGGTSTAGTFSLSGTIGQPDAGAMTGGTFSLSGGFWPGAIPVETCPSDITQDNATNINDLLEVINNWGNCPLPCPPRCTADISPWPAGDCAININDLLDVINSWGPCP